MSDDDPLAFARGCLWGLVASVLLVATLLFVIAVVAALWDAIARLL